MKTRLTNIKYCHIVSHLYIFVKRWKSCSPLYQIYKPTIPKIFNWVHNEPCPLHVGWPRFDYLVRHVLPTTCSTPCYHHYADSFPLLFTEKWDTVRCRYNAVNFIPNPYKIPTISRQNTTHIIGRGMGCNLWFDTDLYSASINPVLYEISYYIGPFYNGTRLYSNFSTFSLVSSFFLLLN